MCMVNQTHVYACTLVWVVMCMIRVPCYIYHLCTYHSVQCQITHDNYLCGAGEDHERPRSLQATCRALLQPLHERGGRGRPIGSVLLLHPEDTKVVAEGVLLDVGVCLCQQLSVVQAAYPCATIAPRLPAGISRRSCDSLCSNCTPLPTAWTSAEAPG